MNNKAPADKFDLESVFKTLDEIEIPKVKGGILPNRAVITERFKPSKQTDLLLEDYYDITSTDGLEEAQEAREDDIAKAKLARIEKIVDLDAEDPDEILPSYVGKVIVQCPQCMTLFYKNKEDIVPSEDDPETVNVEEICQHCGNDSGYTIIGKVAEETPEETTEETAVEETTTEEIPAEETATEETTTEETTEEVPVEETTTEETAVEEIPEEPANESLIASKVLKDAVKDNDLAPKYKGKCELKESDAPAATSIEDAQKWVDYDMKKYGKISERTNNLVKRAGFEIIKDQYGDYEVTAGKYDESLLSADILKDATKTNKLAPEYKAKCKLTEAKEEDETDWEVKTDDIIDLINQKLNLTTDEETSTLVITAKDTDLEDEEAIKLEVELTPEELKVFDTYTQQLDDEDFFDETEETEEEEVEDDLTEDMNLKQNRDVMHAIRDAKLDLETVDFSTADDDIDFDSDEGQFTYDEKTAYIDPCFYLDTKGYADIYEGTKPINAVIRDILKIYPIYKRTINLLKSKTDGKELEVVTLYDKAGNKEGKRIQVKDFEIDPSEELLTDTLDKARSTGAAIKIVGDFENANKLFKNYCREFNENIVELDIEDVEAVEKFLTKLADSKDESFAVVLKNYKENDPEAEEALRKFLRDKQKIHDRTIVVDFKKDASDVNRKLFRYVTDLDSVVTEGLEKLTESKKRILNEAEELNEGPFSKLKDKVQHGLAKVGRSITSKIADSKQSKAILDSIATFTKTPEAKVDLVYGKPAKADLSIKLADGNEKVINRVGTGYNIYVIEATKLTSSAKALLDNDLKKSLANICKGNTNNSNYLSQFRITKPAAEADNLLKAETTAETLSKNGKYAFIATKQLVEAAGDVPTTNKGLPVIIAIAENGKITVDGIVALAQNCLNKFVDYVLNSEQSTQNPNEKPTEEQNPDKKPAEEQNTGEKPAEESPEQSGKPLTDYYNWTAYEGVPFTFRIGTKDKVATIKEEGLDGSTLGKAIETAGKLSTEYSAQIAILGALPDGKLSYVGAVKDGKVVNEDEVKAYLGKISKEGQVESFNTLNNIDEKTLNEHLTRYFTNVYENVNSFKATSCSQKGNSLFVEGLIKFNTGRENKTYFEFKLKESNGNKITLLGKNKMLSESVAFKLNGSVSNNNLITENLKYNYKINNDSVRGSTKK